MRAKKMYLRVGWRTGVVCHIHTRRRASRGRGECRGSSAKGFTSQDAFLNKKLPLGPSSRMLLLSRRYSKRVGDRRSWGGDPWKRWAECGPIPRSGRRGKFLGVHPFGELCWILTHRRPLRRELRGRTVSAFATALFRTGWQVRREAGEGPIDWKAKRMGRWEVFSRRL